MTADEFRARVRAALASPADGALAARFPAPVLTAIVAGAEPGEQERLKIALGELVAALHAVGVPRGRQFVLLGTRLPGPAAELVAWLRTSLGVPVLVHGPHDACFVAGRSDARGPLEVHDELREAEAVVVAGPARAGPDGMEGGVGLLCPGVVSSRTRAAWDHSRAAGPAAALAFALEVERAVPVDLALLWHEDGVVAGGGRERFTALAAAGRSAHVPRRPDSTFGSDAR